MSTLILAEYTHNAALPGRPRVKCGRADFLELKMMKPNYKPDTGPNSNPNTKTRTNLNLSP